MNLFFNLCIVLHFVIEICNLTQMKNWTLIEHKYMIYSVKPVNYKRLPKSII